VDATPIDQHQATTECFHESLSSKTGVHFVSEFRVRYRNIAQVISSQTD